MDREKEDQIIDDLVSYKLEIPLVVREKKPAKKHTPRTAFLHGPVPMSWINTAAKLGKHVLHVGICLWFIAGCEKSLQIKTTRRRIAGYCGVSVQVVGKAFVKLDRAGLIERQHKSGASSTITLIREPLQMEIPFEVQHPGTVTNGNLI